MVPLHGLYFVFPLRWFFLSFLPEWLLLVLKWSVTSLKSRSEIDITWNDSSVQQTQHPILNIILSNRWWIRKRIISIVFRQNPLCKKDFIWPPCSNSKFFKFNVADATLGPAVFKKIRLRQLILISQLLMARAVFRISCQILEFLFVHKSSHWLAQQCKFFARG